MNETTIPNVYNALIQLPEKADLSKAITDGLRSGGFPYEFDAYFVPGTSASGAQIAMMLCISVTTRRALLTEEEVAQFDALISKAADKWTQLQKVNKASRILTDYMG